MYYLYKLLLKVTLQFSPVFEEPNGTCPQLKALTEEEDAEMKEVMEDCRHLNASIGFVDRGVVSPVPPGNEHQQTKQYPFVVIHAYNCVYMRPCLPP